MKKKYKARTNVSISVLLPNGKSKHISFTALTGGGSVFYTDSAEIQHALESHYRYGTLFFEDKEFHVANDAKHVKTESSQEDSVASDGSASEVPPSDATVVVISDADAAKAYLSEHFGVSRTKLRSVSAIKESAAANGIYFEGI